MLGWPAHLVAFQFSPYQKDDLNVPGIFQCAAAMPGFQLAHEILNPGRHGRAVSQHVQSTGASTVLIGKPIGTYKGWLSCREGVSHVHTPQLKLWCQASTKAPDTPLQAAPFELCWKIVASNLYCQIVAKIRAMAGSPSVE